MCNRGTYWPPIFLSMNLAECFLLTVRLNINSQFFLLLFQFYEKILIQDDFVVFF